MLHLRCVARCSSGFPIIFGAALLAVTSAGIGCGINANQLEADNAARIAAQRSELADAQSRLQSSHSADSVHTSALDQILNHSQFQSDLDALSEITATALDELSRLVGGQERVGSRRFLFRYVGSTSAGATKEDVSMRTDSLLASIPLSFTRLATINVKTDFFADTLGLSIQLTAQEEDRKVEALKDYEIRYSLSGDVTLPMSPDSLQMCQNRLLDEECALIELGYRE